MEPVLFFLFAFATIAALIWSALELFRDEEDPLEDRLQELQSNAMVTSARPSRRRAGHGIFNWMLYVVSLAGGEHWIHETEKQLQAAGIRNRRAVALYLLFNVSFLLLLVGVAAYIQREKPPLQILLGLVAPGLLGFLLPKQVLYRLVRRYRRKLHEALPDAVDLLGIVLGTGLALDQAMTRVSEELQHIYPELASEFSTVVMQVRAGQERGKAFNQLVRRTGIEDIKSLAAMIIQSERFGTSLAQALKVYADALRTRRRLRAEAAIGRAGIKMVFPIVIFILPVLFVITLVPGILSVLGDLQNLNTRR
ncbi:MAG: type II secretion system F family protein [Bryobacteraceae bacterium]